MAAKLILDIITDTSKAVAGFKAVSDSAGKTDAKTKTSFKSIAKGAAIAAGSAALGGLVMMFKTGAQEQSDFLSGQAQLAAGIKSTGDAAHVSVAGLENLASSIQGYSGQTDDSIVASEKLLLTFTNIHNQAGKNNDIFNQATKVTADMAARMGGDASKYAVQLGKALNDPAKGLSALTRIGVTFDEGQKKQIKSLQASGHTMAAQKIIMKELNKEFGGSAEAAGKTLPGQLARAKRSFEDISQSLVASLMPVLSQLADILLKYVMPAFAAIMGFIERHKTLFGILAATIGTVVAAWKIWNITLAVWTAIMDANPIFLIVTALIALGVVLVMAYKKSATFRKIVQTAFKVILTAAKAVVAFFTKDIPAAFNAVVNFVKALPARLAAAGKKLWSWILDYYKVQWQLVVAAVTLSIQFVTKIPGWFAAAGKKIWSWIVDFYRVQWNILVGLVTAAVGFVANIPHRFSRAAGAVWSFLVSTFNAAWGAVKTAVSNAVGFVAGIPGRFSRAAGAVWSFLVSTFHTAWAGVKSAVNGAVGWISGLGGRLKNAAGALWGWIGNGLTSAWNTVKGDFNGVVSWIKGLPGRVTRAASGLWSGFGSGFKGAINAVITGWNNLSFTIGGWKLPFPPHTQFPSFTLNTPNIPLLAAGGYVDRATLAVVGERGGEFVTPEPLLRQVIRDELAGAMMQITVNGALDPDAVARQIETLLTRRRARIAGPVRRGTSIGASA